MSGEFLLARALNTGVDPAYTDSSAKASDIQRARTSRFRRCLIYFYGCKRAVLVGMNGPVFHSSLMVWF